MRYMALVLLLISCAGAQDTAPVARDGTLPSADREVTLAIGDTHQLPGGAWLTLTAVPGDSRCPRNVTCVWAGSVAATLRLGVGPADTVGTINTLMTPMAFAFRGWRVALRDASPQPVAGVPIPPESYRVTLLVSRE
jgi:hypothetical protein